MLTQTGTAIFMPHNLPTTTKQAPSRDLHLPTGFMQTLTLFHYDQVQDTQVCINDAAADRLALSLAGSPGAVAGMALAEQQADTAVSQDTLLHGEALLVIATTYPDNITLKNRNASELVMCLSPPEVVDTSADCISMMQRKSPSLQTSLVNTFGTLQKFY